MYLGTGGPGVFESPDGVTWREVHRFGDTESGPGITAMGDGFVVAGTVLQGGLATDATAWTLRLAH